MKIDTKSAENVSHVSFVYPYLLLLAADQLTIAS